MRQHQVPIRARSQVQHLLMLVILMAAWVPLAWSDTGHDKESVVLVTGEWPPFTSEDMERDGFFTAVVTRVFERMDQPYTIQFKPWKRGVAMVEQGEAFATFPYRTTDRRHQKHWFSDPVSSSAGRFFYLNSRFPDGFQWQDYDDLKGYKIGGTLGYWYEPVFRETGLDVEFVVSDEVSLGMLVHGRVDMAAAGERVGWYILDQEFPDAVDKISVADKPLDESTLHLMVSPDYPGSKQLLERFNYHLWRFKKSPEYEELRSQYNAFAPANTDFVQGQPE